MLKQLLIGFLIGIGCIFIHSVAMLTTLRVMKPRMLRIRPASALDLGLVMGSSACLLMAAHVAEAMVWALGFRVTGAVSSEDGPFYFAFVSYTTLGYGDVLAAPEWRLLGPMAAMSGVLLFGWSTAVLFQVMMGALGPDEQK